MIRGKISLLLINGTNMKKVFYAIPVFILTLLGAVDAHAWGSMKNEIYRAAQAGRTDVLQAYINRGYSIDVPDEDGMTALCSARLNHDYKTYNLLLQYGANPYAHCMSYNFAQNSSSSDSGLKIDRKSVV